MTILTVSNGPEVQPQEGGEEDLDNWAQLAGSPQRTAYTDGAPGAAPYDLLWIWNGPEDAGDGGPQVGHLDVYENTEPILGDSKVFIADNNGVIYALALSGSGEPTPAWTYDTQSPIKDAGAYSSDQNAVYFGNMDGYLYKLNASTGALINSVDLGGAIYGGLLLVGDLIIATSMDGNVYARYKTTLGEAWAYDTESSILAAAAYSANYSGLVIVPSEDSYVHAIQIATGVQRWRVLVNSDQDDNENHYDGRFRCSYPVVSDNEDVVLIRSYIDWSKIFAPAIPDTTAGIITYLTNNATYRNLHVLELDDGASRYIAPIMAGAMCDGNIAYGTPPQVALVTYDGDDYAYLWWLHGSLDSDPRDASCIVEMRVSDGDARFVQDHNRTGGSIFAPGDELPYITMIGSQIWSAHWLTYGGSTITDRSSSYGDTYANGIRTTVFKAIANTMGDDQCEGRDQENHYCSATFYGPGEGRTIAGGHYIYRDDVPAYDQFPEPYPDPDVYNAYRHIVYDPTSGVIVLKQPDGSVSAFDTGGA